VLFTLGETHTSAININLNFNANDNQAQAFDPQNLGLHDLFNYAEGYYEDVFEDGGYTLTINYWYADLSDSLLGLLTGAVKSGDRIIEADIRIDTLNDGLPRNWFIDPTPGSDEEFFMQKTVWGDLTVNESDVFTTSGPVPDGIEVGYTGDPLADQSGDDFVGIDDMNIVLGNWNAGTPPASGASIQEPAGLAAPCLSVPVLKRRHHPICRSDV
jgi:hypothetical protein